MPGSKKFKVGKDVYDIPEKEVASFLKDIPDAIEVESYKVGKDTFNIPLNEVSQFLKDVPEAQPLKKKEPSPSPLVLENGISPSEGGASEPSPWRSQFEQQGKTLVGQPTQPLQIPQQQQPLMAPATGGQVAVDQSNYNPELNKKIEVGNELGTSFARGATDVFSNILKSPAFVMDVAQQVATGKVYHSFSAEGNPISNELDQAVEQDRKLQAEKYDKSIYENIQKGDYGTAAKMISNSVAESLPAMFALMLGNAQGATTLQSTLAGGAVFGAGKKTQLDMNNPNMSEEDKVANAAVTGLAEGFFESAFGAVKIPELIKSATAGKTAKEAARIAESTFKEIFLPAFKKYGGNFAEESISEMATQFAENTVDILSGAKKDEGAKSWFEGVPDAGIVGAVMGGGTAGPAFMVEVARKKADRAKAMKYEEQKQTILTDLQNEDVSMPAKAALNEKLKEINVEEADDTKSANEEFNKLLPEEQNQINALIQKQQPLVEAASDINLTEQSRELMKKDIDAIDIEIDAIYEKAAQRKDAEANAEFKDELDAINLQEKEFGFLDDWQKERKSQLEAMFKEEPVAAKVEETTPAETSPEGTGTTPVQEPPAQEVKTTEKQTETPAFDEKFSEIYSQLEKEGKITKKGDCP